jgi:hypothetical protein
VRKLLLTNELAIALLLVLGLSIATLPPQSYANDVTIPPLAQAQFEYEYADGAGNRYIIDRDSIDYRPISKMQSSSLNYDGGKPRKVSINARQYQEIAAMLDRAFNLTTSNADGKLGRAKGTGLISKPDKQRQIHSRIIDRNRPERAEIEALLKKSLDR